MRVGGCSGATGRSPLEPPDRSNGGDGGEPCWTSPRRLRWRARRSAKASSATSRSCAVQDAVRRVVCGDGEKQLY